MGGASPIITSIGLDSATCEALGTQNGIVTMVTSHHDSLRALLTHLDWLVEGGFRSSQEDAGKSNWFIHCKGTHPLSLAIPKQLAWPAYLFPVAIADRTRHSGHWGQ